MVVDKVGDRYHIRKKDGTPGKTSFASKRAALNAQANLKKLSAKNKTTTKKKKSTKKKSSTKKGSGKKMAKKRSWVGYLRLGVYIAAIGGQAIRQVNAYGFNRHGAQAIAERYTARDSRGQYSGAVAAETYAPLAVVALADTIASKLGVYKRMGSL